MSAITPGSSATPRPTIFSVIRAASTSAAGCAAASRRVASARARREQRRRLRGRFGAPLREALEARPLACGAGAGEHGVGVGARRRQQRVCVGARVDHQPRHHVSHRLDHAPHWQLTRSPSLRGAQQHAAERHGQPLRDGGDGGGPLAGERVRERARAELT